MVIDVDARILGSTCFVAELPLCNLYLQNESRFPWLVLVPRQENASELIDLSMEDQQELTREIVMVSQLMKAKYSPDKLNVANLGNIVKQLHVHVIARYESDSAWPGPVWGKFDAPLMYDGEELEAKAAEIRAELVNYAV
ncbi:HIT domain-containing protein [Wohlfahrtiimonas populi]|uniref:HIT domain-containing protein n=1 Tax=Wohlfahrtiimonas populi TaxID=1940240 RepID=UPI001E3B2A14|nr:HIT family protein [Wohlfahrtiimonas populi]